MNRFNGYFFACCWYFSTVFILNVRLVWWRRSTTTGCCWNISPPTSSSSWNISKCSNMPTNQIMVSSHFLLFLVVDKKINQNQKSNIFKKNLNMPINQIMVRSHFPLVRTPHHAKQKCQKEIDSLSHSFNFQPWFPASLRGPWREEGWVRSTKDNYLNNFRKKCFFFYCAQSNQASFS